MITCAHGLQNIREQLSAAQEDHFIPVELVHSPLLLEGLILLQLTVQLQQLRSLQELRSLCVISRLIEELQGPGLPGVIRQ